MDLGMFAKKIQVSGILSKYDVSIKEAKIIGAVIEELEQQCKKQKEVIDKLELENKVLKEQMVAMVKLNYTYGVR